MDEGNYDDDLPCIVWTYLFDKHGNKVREDLNRTGTYYGYIYNESSELIDWTWEDKRTGEITFFSKELPSKEFEESLIELNESKKEINKKFLKISDKASYIIADTCFSINAIYEIENIMESSELPSHAIARKISEAKPSEHGFGNFDSLELLYFYFDYKFKVEQTNYIF